MSKLYLDFEKLIKRSIWHQNAKGLTKQLGKVSTLCPEY